ncbi:unnamed protein product [Cochlearia groenlandica]
MGCLAPVMEKKQSFQEESMEEQESLRCVGAENPARKVRGLEKQVRFQSGNVVKHVINERSMEKQEKVMEKQEKLMERQRSILGFVEKQRSFRVVMERQLSFMKVGDERKLNNDSPRKRGDSPLHIAARTGNLGKVMELIRGCSSGVEESKDLLSKQNLEGETPLYIAAENGHCLVVEEMLKHMDLETASVAARNGFDPFHVAAKQGHLGVVNLLLKTDSHLAKIAKNMICVRFRKDNQTAMEGAPCHTYQNTGKTALHSAARMGHFEVVKSLISNDASICIRTDKKGQTALHMAVKGKIEGIVLELVKPDPAVLSVGDNKGNTPLHVAAKKGRTKIVRCLISLDGIDLNALNKGGDTSLDIAEKIGNTEIVWVLKEAGAATGKDLGKPQNPAKHLKQTVSDIRHEVQSQLQQSRQTGARVQRIAKRLKKLHINGLNNAINSATVVAVLIATVAFAAIFTIPGQYEEDITKGALLLGEARIANKPQFLVFFIFDSLALFISLVVVVVQTSVVVIEQKAKKKLVFVINKLMWLACLFITIAFVSLSFVVVGKEDIWLADCIMVIGGTIMLTTIGAMCYCVIMHRIEEYKLKSMRKERSKTRSFSLSHMPSESEILNGEFSKRMYAL